MPGCNEKEKASDLPLAFRLSKKVAERRPFSYIIDMGDALC